MKLHEIYEVLVLRGVISVTVVALKVKAGLAVTSFCRSAWRLWQTAF